MKDWDDLQTVLALGRAGTMKGAAQSLGVSETTVSRRIQKMSRGDVSLLFSRDGQRWLPTKVGMRLIDVAETVEKQIFAADTIFDDRPNGLTGSLRISSISFINTHFIGPQMIDFQRHHPDLKISLEASDERVSLAYREADVALRLARPTEGRLIGKKLALIPMVAVVPAMSRPREWVGLPESLDWTPEMQLGHRHWGAPPRLRLDSFDGVLNVLKMEKLGGVAPSCLVRKLDDDFTITSQPTHRELWVAYHEDLRNSAKIRALIDWLTTAMPHSGRCLCGQCSI